MPWVLRPLGALSAHRAVLLLSNKGGRQLALLPTARTSTSLDSGSKERAIPPGGDPQHHLLQDPLIQRVVRPPGPPTGQGQFMSVNTACPRALSFHSLPVQDH
jgi:hypothetical protein